MCLGAVLCCAVVRLEIISLVLSFSSQGFASSPASMKIFFSFLIKGHKQTKDQEFEIKLVEENICISFLGSARDEEGEIER